MKITIATQITCIRILLVPFIVFSIMQGSWGQVLMLYAAAMITDFIDGFIARKYRQESVVGALLDPIADKLLICASLCGLMYTKLTNVSLQCGIILILIKELILIVGGAILFTQYNLFIKPSLFSRVVSVAEMLFVLLVVVASYVEYTISDSILSGVLGVILMPAIILLLWYSLIIVKIGQRSS